MKKLVTVLCLVLNGFVMAAPTPHDMVKGLITMSDANNEADGPFNYKACIKSLGSFENPADWIDSKSMYQVSIISSSDGGELYSKNYQVTVGYGWQMKSLNLLGANKVQADQGCGQSDWELNYVRNDNYQIEFVR